MVLPWHSDWVHRHQARRHPGVSMRARSCREPRSSSWWPVRRCLSGSGRQVQRLVPVRHWGDPLRWNNCHPAAPGHDPNSRVHPQACPSTGQRERPHIVGYRLTHCPALVRVVHGRGRARCVRAVPAARLGDRRRPRREEAPSLPGGHRRRPVRDRLSCRTRLGWAVAATPRKWEEAGNRHRIGGSDRDRHRATIGRESCADQVLTDMRRNT